MQRLLPNASSVRPVPQIISGLAVQFGEDRALAATLKNRIRLGLDYQPRDPEQKVSDFIAW
jgi:hypothetical protein